MALEVRFHDVHDAHGLSLPDELITVDEGAVLVIGRSPNSARESHPAVIADRRLIAVAIKPNDPKGTCLSRVQLAIYADDVGLPRVLNLGRPNKSVELQRFGRHARRLPVAPLRARVRASGELLPSACTIWLPLTAPEAKRRRISILNSPAYESEVDNNGREPPNTYGEAIFPWPPPAQAYALVALAAPLLRFPAIKRFPAVEPLHKTTLRSGADQLVRNLREFSVRLNTRTPETIEYLLDSGAITLRRLHDAYAEAPAGSRLREDLHEAEALHAWFEKHRRIW